MALKNASWELDVLPPSGASPAISTGMWCATRLLNEVGIDA